MNLAFKMLKIVQIYEISSYCYAAIILKCEYINKCLIL